MTPAMDAVATALGVCGSPPPAGEPPAGQRWGVGGFPRGRHGVVSSSVPVCPSPQATRAPPSTTTVVPVMYDDASLARKSATRPISSGVPARGIGSFP